MLVAPIFLNCAKTSWLSGLVKRKPVPSGVAPWIQLLGYWVVKPLLLHCEHQAKPGFAVGVTGVGDGVGLGVGDGVGEGVGLGVGALVAVAVGEAAVWLPRTISTPPTMIAISNTRMAQTETMISVVFFGSGPRGGMGRGGMLPNCWPGSRGCDG